MLKVTAVSHPLHLTLDSIWYSVIFSNLKKEKEKLQDENIMSAKTDQDGLVTSETATCFPSSRVLEPHFLLVGKMNCKMYRTPQTIPLSCAV